MVMGMKKKPSVSPIYGGLLFMILWSFVTLVENEEEPQKP